jgi:hypothetical protein
MGAVLASDITLETSKPFFIMMVSALNIYRRSRADKKVFVFVFMGILFLLFAKKACQKLRIKQKTFTKKQ